ncbi:MAG: glycosyltransferase family 9 protein, partial [Bacteroidota bacterium]
PALRALRAHFSHAEIWFLVRSAFVPLFKGADFVDRVVGLSDSARIIPLLRMAARMRKERFDLLCSLSPIRRNTLLTLLGSSRYAVGYLSLGKKIPNFLKESRVSSIGINLVSQEKYAQENIAESALKVCYALGIPCSERAPHLEFSEKSVRIAEEALASREAAPPIPFIVVHPFAGWRYREWPYANTVELIKRILSDLAIHVTLIGSREEEDKLRWITKQIGNSDDITILAGEDFATLAVLLSKSLLFIGSDSGPIHLASAVGTPCIGLFGPAPPAITGPTRTKNRFLYHRVECSPCKQSYCIRPQNSCLSLITVDEVYAHVKEALSEAVASTLV